jgi:hypothetical protein
MSAAAYRRCRLLSPKSAIIAEVGYDRRSRRSASVADVSARLLSLMSADIADVGYYRRCRLCCRRCRLLSLSLLSLMPLLFVRCLHSEIDAAGQANALEAPFLLSSDGIVADVELNQRPHIGDGIGKGDNAKWFRAWWA